MMPTSHPGSARSCLSPEGLETEGPGFVADAEQPPSWRPPGGHYCCVSETECYLPKLCGPNWSKVKGGEDS